MIYVVFLRKNVLELFIQSSKVMSNKKIAYAILTIAVAANVALAVGFKMYFFNAPLQRYKKRIRIGHYIDQSDDLKS